MADSKPWKDTLKPHASTTPFSRFGSNLSSSWTSPYSGSLSQAVYEARCEVTSTDIAAPIGLCMSPDTTCLAVPCISHRSHLLLHYLPGEAPGSKFLKCHSTDSRLEDQEPALEIAADEERKLILLGGSRRIKTYHWEKDLGVHTMDSRKFNGPLAVLSNGRVIRAGLGRAAVWNLDSLDTHGEHRDIIGEEMDPFDCLNHNCDDPEHVELSTGSLPDSKITFQDGKMKPLKWVHHPSSPGTMISVVGNDGSCLTLDLEHNAKVGSEFFGHSGHVASISTDPSASAHTFATGCTDGFAHLYDVRTPARPVTSIRTGERNRPQVLLANPDGIPTIFTGCAALEVVRMWDVRARSLVYELGTGNNTVDSLAWDPARSCLYAATHCDYTDYYGNYYGYRSVKWPKESDSMDYDDDDDDDDDDEDMGWPKKAQHKEDYFGHVCDSGDHRLICYKFKSDADPKILPEYGNATPTRDY